MLVLEEEADASTGTTFPWATQNPEPEPSPDPTSGATESEPEPEPQTSVSGFIEGADGGSRMFECDPWTGEPCGPDEKCMPWDNSGQGAWNATRCSPIAPDPAGPGEPCTVEGSGVSGLDDCEAFSMCWAVDPETGQGTCVPFCAGSEANPICHDPCRTCWVTASSALILCLPMCDPLAQDCGERQARYGVAGKFICAPYVGGSDAGQPGDPCEYLNVCEPGSFCASASAVEGCTGSPGCCAPFCDLTAAIQCEGTSPDTACVPWFEEGSAPVLCAPYDRVGACVHPG
jgi:hypothetical protein